MARKKVLTSLAPNTVPTPDLVLTQVGNRYTTPDGYVELKGNKAYCYGVGGGSVGGSSIIPPMGVNDDNENVCTTDMFFTKDFGVWGSVVSSNFAYIPFTDNFSPMGLTETSDDGIGKYVQIDFNEDITIKSVGVYYRTSEVATGFTVSAKVDGSWVVLGTITGKTSVSHISKELFTLDNPTKVSALKITTEGGGANKRMIICNVVCK